MELRKLETDLFSPVTLGEIELSNRIVMSPVTRNRVGFDGIPNSINATYYWQRATAGLIISEATNISPFAVEDLPSPGIWTSQQVTGWKLVTDAVHSMNGKIVNQLWHIGRHQNQKQHHSHRSALNSRQGINFNYPDYLNTSLINTLETHEIGIIVEQYKHAGKCALDAGFDGVELHAANVYLIDQFIRDSTNKRTDHYGGSIENRTRIAIEVIQALTEIWGKGRVGIKLSPLNSSGKTPLDSDVMATYGYLLNKLNDFGLAYVHFVESNKEGSQKSEENLNLDILRKEFKGSYIGNNQYDLKTAIQRRAEGKIDAVAFGRLYIGNPDLVYRLMNNLPLIDAPKETYCGGGAEGYTDWKTYK
jgi:N-ethylmaleimide reductase